MRVTSGKNGESEDVSYDRAGYTFIGSIMYSICHPCRENLTKTDLFLSQRSRAETIYIKDGCIIVSFEFLLGFFGISKGQIVEITSETRPLRTFKY